MYQDPVQYAMLRARLRVEMGMVKSELMARGLDASAADQAAQRWLKNSTSNIPSADFQNVQQVSQRLEASRQKFMSEVPLPSKEVQGMYDRQEFDKFLDSQDIEKALQVQVEPVDPNPSPAWEEVYGEKATPIPPQEVYEASSAVAPDITVETTPNLKVQSPGSTDTALRSVGMQPVRAAEAPRPMAELQVPTEIQQPRAGLSATQEQALRTGGTQSVTAPAKETSDTANMGAILAVMGAAQQVIGNFYAIKSQQTQLKQQAMSLEFQQRMSQINARAAERQASDMIAAGRQQAMETTLRAGQAREGARATMAARGVRANVGSGAEVVASINLMKEIDRFTIDANAVRAAGAARMQAVNASNEGLLAGTSAFTLRQQAGALNPVAGAMPSLLTGVGQFYSQRAADRRWAAWAASQGLGE